MLGEFEYLVMSAAARLAENAVWRGDSSRRSSHAAKRPCSLGALYTTLDRLEAKGLIETWMGEATAEHSGRAAYGAGHGERRP